MARYRGPRSKISRRFSEPIFGRSKALQRKNYPPGMHGRGRKRHSEYALQLAEKQKAKYIYGVLERQFFNIFRRAFNSEGITGEVLIQLLERRLDNVVYRLKLAPSRRAARQLVSHRHILVNDRVTNIPSYTLSVGDRIGVRSGSLNLLRIQESLQEGDVSRHAWLDFDEKKLSGVLLMLPSREKVMENIKEQLIVELYSK